MSNFTFLKSEWPALFDDASATEANVFAQPRTCVFYARRTLEKMTKWMYAHDSYLQMPYQNNLAALIHEPTFKDTLAPKLFPQVRLIHQFGNQAVHSDTHINPQDALNITRCLHRVVGWMARAYTKDGAEVAKFDEALVPRPADPQEIADQSAEQLQALHQSLSDKDKAFAESQAKLADTEEQLAELKAEIQRIKAENRKTIRDEDYSEAETRDLFIDLMLREAGWDPHGENVPEYKVVGMPKKDGSRTGTGYVDYVLWGEDGLPLAVVEAKRTKADSTVGQRQAELYADCLEQMTGQRPLIFYTNGYETWFWDDQRYPAREVQGFYTKDELQLAINRRTSLEDITKAEANRNIVDRYYHEEAVKRIMESYGASAREALVVMATGTGKTRLSIASVEILMKHNWVRRVLFLADRTALLNQAKKAFNKHLPHATLANLVDEKETENARIVFSTYPTMANMIDNSKKDGARKYGVGHFDLIIIDEAHRSVYQKYRAIFEYFDSLLLGLTATPRSEVDRDTYGLFGLETGNPTFAYELDRAVSDGFLVNFRPLSVPLRFIREGVTYDDLLEEEKEEYEEKFYDEETEQLPPEINAAALNKWLFNQDTVDKVLRKLMEDGLAVAGGDRIGKTIIFAKNHDHAEFIVKRYNANYPGGKGQDCRVIDNYVKYAQSLIDDFSVKDKVPHIAVSVDMLDTGIDVPEIVNLVFFKVVRSRTKFWQMIGRGTRLCPDLFGPGKDKECFNIFDYCQNLEFFGENPQGYEAPVQDSVKAKIFKRRLDIVSHLEKVSNANTAEATEEYENKEKDSESLTQLVTDLKDSMHGVVSRLDVDNFIVRPKRRYVEEYADRKRWDRLSRTDEIDINENLAALPYDDEDEEMARRFDLLVLNIQLAILESSPRQARLQRQVISLAGNLEEKQNIPAVAKQLELILEIQRDEYWQNITLPMLESARKRLRDLIKFIDKTGGQDSVYTRFMDELGDETEVQGLINADPQLANYRLRVERFIREHETHPTIQRIKNNQQLHEGDIDSLEAILFSEEGPGTREEFIETYGADEPLGVFIRKIVGLDRNAAKAAFAEFLGEGKYSADQIKFIDAIIDHITQNGLMEPALLFEPPFTDFHDQGVSGVLGADADEIVGIIESINANASNLS